MRNTNRLLAALLGIVLLLSVLQSGILTAFAQDHDGQVRVIVENTTYTDASAAWSGTLVDEWVTLDADATMMSCVVDALRANGYTQRGAESNYISEINGLSAFDGGSMSGWMGTLNDWFTNEGFGAFTVASGKLSGGDEIRIMYTMSYGSDLGGSWGNTDKTLKGLSFSDGTLSPAFGSDVHAYTLNVPSDVNGVVVTPTASNKNYQVRTSVNGTEYKRTASVPVEDGTVITVKCGDPAWPSMNGGSGEAQVYTVTVAFESPAIDEKEEKNKRLADAVIALIDAIGEVTRASGDAIASARAAYDSLTDEQKALVGNYTTLLAAESAYAALAKPDVDLNEIYQSVGDYLASLGTPGVGSVGGEWMAIGLARGGRDVPVAYYDAVAAYVQEHINDKEQLHRSKATDNARVILALTALGYGVTDVAGHDLLAGLSELSYIQKQGINGPIWALIAFDCHDYELPAGDVTREALVNAILDAQLADGGWALSGTFADADMTAMAIQVLAKYYGTDANVKAAVDNALERLSAMQAADGGYLSWGTENAESCAQVIVALTALGIDPQTDARFLKNGCSVLDALLAFYTDGGFCHIMGGGVNGMATEQGYYALVSYVRLKEEKTSLYDMRDVTVRAGEDPDDSSVDASDDTSDVQGPQVGDSANVVVYLGLMMLSLVGLAAVAAFRRKSTCGR